MDITDYLNKKVKVIVDRPLDSKHPKFNYFYQVNYGFIPNTKNTDGEEIDAYILGVNKPIKKFEGKVIAVIHRLDDDDDKLIVVPENFNPTDQEIEKSVEFQEKYFKHKIIR